MIYSIKRLANACDVLDLDIFTLSEKLQPYAPPEVDILNFLYEQPFNGTNLSEFWPEELACNFLHESKDTYQDINSFDGWLVLTLKAYNILKDYLLDYGEFLKVNAEGTPLVIFNPCKFGKENLQLCEKEYIDGVDIGFKSISFDEDDVKNKLIFKSKITDCAVLYCNEKLKNIIEENQLAGIIFDSDINNIY